LGSNGCAFPSEVKSVSTDQEILKVSDHDSKSS
jgi:hypothetical protein